jgi:hypothetical protein
MKKPSKSEVMGYIADVANQLASMSEKHDRSLAAILRCAAELARNGGKPKRAAVTR